MSSRSAVPQVEAQQLGPFQRCAIVTEPDERADPGEVTVWRVEGTHHQLRPWPGLPAPNRMLVGKNWLPEIGTPMLFHGSDGYELRTSRDGSEDKTDAGFVGTVMAWWREP